MWEEEFAFALGREGREQRRLDADGMASPGFLRIGSSSGGKTDT